jgi:Homeodomain-like domain
VRLPPPPQYGEAALAATPPAVQGELALGDYHGQKDRYQARVQVIKLYYQGWHKLSISRVLRVSRPTVDRWIHRFEAEHFAGLVDQSCAPKVPARKMDLQEGRCDKTPFSGILNPRISLFIFGPGNLL